jgi:hypothetical protein
MCEIGRSMDHMRLVYGLHSLAVSGSAFSSYHMEFHKGHGLTVPALFCTYEFVLQVHLVSWALSSSQALIQI